MILLKINCLHDMLNYTCERDPDDKENSFFLFHYHRTMRHGVQALRLFCPACTEDPGDISDSLNYPLLNKLSLVF